MSGACEFATSVMERIMCLIILISKGNLTTLEPTLILSMPFCRLYLLVERAFVQTLLMPSRVTLCALMPSVAVEKV